MSLAPSRIQMHQLYKQILRKSPMSNQCRAEEEKAFTITMYALPMPKTMLSDSRRC